MRKIPWKHRKQWCQSATPGNRVIFRAKNIGVDVLPTGVISDWTSSICAAWAHSLQTRTYTHTLSHTHGFQCTQSHCILADALRHVNRSIRMERNRVAIFWITHWNFWYTNPVTYIRSFISILPALPSSTFVAAVLCVFFAPSFDSMTRRHRVAVEMRVSARKWRLLSPVEYTWD